MGDFDVSDSAYLTAWLEAQKAWRRGDLDCDCACADHSLRRDLECQVAELRQKNALLEEAVRQLEETVNVCRPEAW